MRSFACFSVLPLVLVLAGCPDKKPPPTPTEADGAAASSAAVSADAAPAASATPVTDAGDDRAARAANMQNCPSAVPGATVTIKDIDDGVEVSVTAKDDAAVGDIRARMSKLVTADHNETDAGIRHTGNGEGHGIYGRCTIVMKNTNLATSEIPGGAKATVKMSDKKQVDWLRLETRDRDKEAHAPGGGEAAGKHRMAHCPSAVEGSKTAVKNTKEGVVVTVTVAGDQGIAEIRQRAKHTAEIAAMPVPPKVGHNSEGQGGGGLGRCPVVVEGDTTVDAKDVPGGSEITVKAKKDVPALQKETADRAANFTVK